MSITPKKNHSGPIHKTDKYFRDLENYFYASNALFKKRIKNNNFSVIFDGDCK